MLRPSTDAEDAREEDEQNEKGESFTKSFAGLCAILRKPGLILAERPRFNEMLQRPTVAGEPVTDTFVIGLRERIETTIKDSKGRGLRFGVEDIEQALQHLSAGQRYHPVREYLRGLRWDGEPRLAHVAADVLGAEDALSAVIIERWFISAVARPLRPGCKVDTVLILQGPQGKMKSSFFTTLAGPENFSDSPIDLHSKDALLVLSGTWILEWAELDALLRAKSSEAVKSFITSQADFFRPPYARTAIKVPRAGVITGSSNRDDFLSDATGNRRFWVVPLPEGRSIDIPKLETQRDQLWAEAVARFDAGEVWWLDEQQDAELAEVQRDFEARHPWQKRIDGYLSEPTRSEVSVPEILEQLLDKPVGLWNRSDEMAVGACLRAAGWERRRTRSPGRRTYVYTRPMVKT